MFIRKFSKLTRVKFKQSLKLQKYMCLAIPGKIISVEVPEDGGLKTAVVDFGGILKNICIEWVEATPGEYVLAACRSRTDNNRY